MFINKKYLNIFPLSRDVAIWHKNTLFISKHFQLIVDTLQRSFGKSHQLDIVCKSCCPYWILPQDTGEIVSATPYLDGWRHLRLPCSRSYDAFIFFLIGLIHFNGFLNYYSLVFPYEYNEIYITELNCRVPLITLILIWISMSGHISLFEVIHCL